MFISVDTGSSPLSSYPLGIRDAMHVSLQDRIALRMRRTLAVERVDGVLLLMVAHTIHKEGDTEGVQILSARRATSNERRQDEDENS